MPIQFQRRWFSCTASKFTASCRELEGERPRHWWDRLATQATRPLEIPGWLDRPRAVITWLVMLGVYIRDSPRHGGWLLFLCFQCEFRKTQRRLNAHGAAADPRHSRLGTVPNGNLGMSHCVEWRHVGILLHAQVAHSHGRTMVHTINKVCQTKSLHSRLHCWVNSYFSRNLAPANRASAEPLDHHHGQSQHNLLAQTYFWCSYGERDVRDKSHTRMAPKRKLRLEVKGWRIMESVKG